QPVARDPGGGCPNAEGLGRQGAGPGVLAGNDCLGRRGRDGEAASGLSTQPSPPRRRGPIGVDKRGSVSASPRGFLLFTRDSSRRGATCPPQVRSSSTILLRRARYQVRFARGRAL